MLYIYTHTHIYIHMYPGGSVVKNMPTNAKHAASIPGSGRSPAEGNGNPLQYSCLENPMDGGAWWATVRGVAKSQTRLSHFTHFTLPKRKWKWKLLSSVQSPSRVSLPVTPWTAARQASLSITNSQNLLKLVSIKSVMPSNHLILCRPLLLQPSTFPSIRVFSNESVLRIRWPKYWSFSFNISHSNEYSGLISFRMD